METTETKARKASRAKLGTLGEANYRRYAQAAIEKYADKGMLADALLWGEIIRRYEEALKAAGVGQEVG